RLLPSSNWLPLANPDLCGSSIIVPQQLDVARTTTPTAFSTFLVTGRDLIKSGGVSLQDQVKIIGGMLGSCSKRARRRETALSILVIAVIHEQNGYVDNRHSSSSTVR
ncbi:hypothetical protein ACH5RR_018421, partial [Cinchona calisaya]